MSVPSTWYNLMSHCGDHKVHAVGIAAMDITQRLRKVLSSASSSVHSFNAIVRAAEEARSVWQHRHS